MWYLYILKCINDSFYTGITKDITNRLEKHNSGHGARYTRFNRPVQLVYFESHKTESEVRKREREIKRWNRNKKLELVKGFPSERLTAILRISGQ